MNEIFKINLIVILSIFFTACTPNYYYLKPEIYGKIYDNKTKNPIKNAKGYITYYISSNNNEMIKTDSTGGFKISPEAKYYYIFRPNMKKLSLSAPQIYISFKKYKSKIYDYSNGELINKIEGNPGGKILEKVDVGIIYLDPE